MKSQIGKFANVRKIAEMGADFVSILTPSYFKKCLTDEAMIGYYTEVADEVPLPVIAYNAPGFTGMNLSPTVVEAISGLIKRRPSWGTD